MFGEKSLHIFLIFLANIANAFYKKHFISIIAFYKKCFSKLQAINSIMVTIYKSMNIPLNVSGWLRQGIQGRVLSNG